MKKLIALIAGFLIPLAALAQGVPGSGGYSMQANLNAGFEQPIPVYFANANGSSIMFPPQTAVAITGNQNSVFGKNAGATLTTGTNNILIGYSADVPTASTNYTAHFNNGAGDVLSWTGAGTPSTSTAAFAGNLNVGGSINLTGSGFVNLGVPTYDVRTYGAVCDNVTDDSAAWTAAIRAIYTQTPPTGSLVSGRLVGCQYSHVTASINATGTSAVPVFPGNVVLDFSGTTITGSLTQTSASTVGNVIFDAMGLRHVKIANLGLVGDCTSGVEPNMGMQVGRYGTSISADDNTLDHVTISGCFRTAGLYNNASEDLHLLDVMIRNADTVGNTHGVAYGLVQDGWDYWNAGSLYATGCAVLTGCSGLTQNSYESMNETVMLGGQVLSSGNVAPLWMGGGRGHRYIGVYMNTCAQYAAKLFQETGVTTSTTAQIGAAKQSNDVFDIHFENNTGSCSAGSWANLYSTFQYDWVIDTLVGNGAAPTPTLMDITWRNHEDKAAGAGFALSSNVTSVTFNNLVDLIGVESPSNPALATTITAGSASIAVTNTFAPNDPVSFTGSFGSVTGVSPNVTYYVNTTGLSTSAIQICAALGCGGGSITPAGSGTATPTMLHAATPFDNAANFNFNTAFGPYAGGGSDISASGTNNVSVGDFALGALSSGASNMAIGTNALVALTTANNNSAGGANTLHYVTTGAANTAFGADAGQFVGTTAANNTAIGAFALKGVVGTKTTGAANTAIGASALAGTITTGASNTALGYQAGYTNTTGTNNLFLGYQVGSTTETTGSNNVVIGTSSSCDTSTSAAANEADFCAGGPAYLTVTGAGTPSTSTAAFAGKLAATGGYVHGTTVLCESASAVTHTGDTLETRLTGCTVPANFLGTDGSIRVTVHWSRTATTTDSVSFVVRYSSAQGIAGATYVNVANATSGVTGYQTVNLFHNNHATGAQQGFSINTGAATGAESSSTTGTVDSTATSYVNFTCKDTTSSADTCGVYWYLVEAIIP